MRFGKTLARSVYPPWADKYIDYGKLKSMLREGKLEDGDVPWTEEDENRFCDEIFNTQLEKVARFQEETVSELRRRADVAFETLKSLAPDDNDNGDGDGDAPERDIPADQLRALEAELDDITNTVKELKKYSSVNYTGFLKMVKKHDRKRGERYKIRPIMQVSLSKRPFNSERGYSPLLNKLSLMYFAIRQQLEENGGDVVDIDPESRAETHHNGEKYTAYKFWVHPDNLIEVKTLILRRLPALVYSQQSARGGDADGSEDTSLTSLYFDNSRFELYSRKADREPHSAAASSVRLRWYGQLSSKPDIFLEHKIVHDAGGSEERKFNIKEKYVKPFLDGEYHMEKSIQKMRRQGQPDEEVEAFRATAGAMQGFIREHGLEPVLRANYVRTAFQKPGDDRVRIAIDTDVAFVREDTLDHGRPCRDPGDWHRPDIDSSGMTYPFRNINQSEVSRFPYAILEIKLKEEQQPGRRRPAWVEDLTASHLVHAAPRFSKFVHGTASLFEDYVNVLPFWLSDLETDIRKDPRAVFEEEEQKRAQRVENEQAVGSFLGARAGSFVPSTGSPVARSYLGEGTSPSERRQTGGAATTAGAAGAAASVSAAVAEEGDDRDETEEPRRRNYGAISSVLPGFSLTRYAKAKRARETPGEEELPPGVVEPREWIKNSGPLQIEPKVWLANERTFLKWQHISVLLGGLAVSLYNAAGRGTVGEAMGIAYVVVALFAGAWGYWILRTRRGMIIQRSGKHFDNLVGPIVISVALVLALILNFILAYRSAFKRLADHEDRPPLNSSRITDELRF